MNAVLAGLVRIPLLDAKPQSDLSQKSANSPVTTHSALRADRYNTKEEQESGPTGRERAVVPGRNHDDKLSGSRDTVLILRLVLDGQARLLHGELLDADAVGQGRFMTLAGLVEAVKRWLERQQRDLAPKGDHTT